MSPLYLLNKLINFQTKKCPISLTPHSSLPHHCSLFLQCPLILIYIAHCSKSKLSFSAFQITPSVLGSTRPTSASMIDQEDSQDSAYSCTHSQIYYSKRRQRKSSKRKRQHRVKYRGNQKQACKALFSVKTHGMCLIPPLQ